MALYRNKELYDYIKELDIVPQKELESIYKRSVSQKKDFGDALVDEDLISDANLGKAVADMTSVPFVVLSDTSIDRSILGIIPEIVAKKQKVIAFKKDKNGLHLALNDPTNKQIIDFVNKKVGIPVVSYYSTNRDITNAFNLYREEVKDVFDEIIKESVKKAKGAKKADPSIIKIVDTVIDYAYQNKASDIHLEPYEEKSLTRFRIDGILHDVVELPREFHPQIVTRVKVLAQLRTDEHQTAQDGKLTYKTKSEDLDIRVSIVPTTEGEKVVMRVLSERSRQFSLVDLGFSEKDLGKIKIAYEKPHGMVLATGPTGSGKTTTLYAILKLLNKRDINIMTIEDPVEYDIEGVNQIQVNTKTELTFAKGLRSIVRQDPDIILVGEIRDEETADISINAAMTGHLVLSTLHTNDAATTIPRLLDLGIEPFLVGSTVNIVIAQRLVRKICQSCRHSRDLNLEKIGDQSRKELGMSPKTVNKFFKEQKKVRVYQGKGCEACHDTGYSGRVGIYEVLVIDEDIRELIMQRKDSNEIHTKAVEMGMITMVENGMEKVKQGITTIEEILRVTKE